MRYAVIEAGRVTNVVEANAPISGLTMVPSDTADIGWSWTGTTFVPPAPPPPPVPASITARQLRLWLVRNGHALAQVEALINALPEPQRTEARIEWEAATQFERAHPLLRQLAGALLNREGPALDAALSAAYSEAATY